MSNYFKLQIKVKKLNDGEFEDQKTGKIIEYFQLIEDGGIVEPKFRMKKEMYQKLLKDKVEGKEIFIYLERKLAADKSGKLVNFVGDVIQAYDLND